MNVRETKVLQYSLSGVLIAEYNSIKEAAEKNHIHAVSISRCCRGERNSHNGSVWVYAAKSNESQDRFKKVIDLEGEVWRDINGFDGLYQVSSLGRVKSLEKVIKYDNGEKHLGERLLSFETDKHGYYRTLLRKRGKGYHQLVHRLVCKAFVGNPNNSPEVNHINGIKNDNRAENLEWCTRSENEQHAYNNGLAKGQPGHLRPMAKPIRLIHLATNKILQFGCIADCARFFKGQQKNLEAALRYHANREKKTQFRGYKVEFITN